MKRYSDKNEQLKSAYRSWVDEIKDKYPEFLSDKYSNPYYTSIPNDWYDKNRIYIVGEEGFGSQKDSSEKFDDFDMIQRFNTDYMMLNLNKSTGYNKSPFWNRIRKIYGLSDSEIGITWGNLDKIHILHKSNCQLSDPEKHKLHSLKCNILYREIEILDPTIVVFFGWYYVSISYDFKPYYSIITSEYEKNKKCPFDLIIDERVCIFSNHPNWGQRQKGYENLVLALVKKHLN